MPRKRSPQNRINITMQDIARELGVSAMTVSRALSGHPDVNEEKRQKIIDLARELGYRPNRWARTLITNRSNLIGVVIPDISQPFFCDITRGVEDVVGPKGYDILFCHSDRSRQREVREIDMLLSRRVDGLVIASEQSAGKLDILQDLNKQNVPFVLIDRYFAGFDCYRVRTDDHEVGRLATNHLIELGHRRIAHITGPDVSTGTLRLEGYLQALREAGLPVEQQYIVRSNFTSFGGYDAMKTLLALRPRPTAVFAANDPLAYGAIEACRDAGAPVPQSISVAGAGNIDIAHHPDPFVTTVEWSRGEMGRAAGRILLKLMIDGKKPRTRDWVIPPELLVRRSTRPPRQ